MRLSSSGLRRPVRIWRSASPPTSRCRATTTATDGSTWRVYRPSNGIWYVIYSSTGALVQLQWGVATDVPMPADYTGDGRTDLCGLASLDRRVVHLRSVDRDLHEPPVGRQHRHPADRRLRRRRQGGRGRVPAVERVLVRVLLVHADLRVLPVGHQHRHSAAGRLHGRRPHRSRGVPAVERVLVRVRLYHRHLRRRISGA